MSVDAEPAQLDFMGETHSTLYAAHRPSMDEQIAKKLRQFLKVNIPKDQWQLAVDVGCGPGQSTLIWSKYFKEVRGFDISRSQIESARKSNSFENVWFEVSSAESLPIESNSVQLLNASKCIHWFDLDMFMPEIDRVLCPGGVFAVSGSPPQVGVTLITEPVGDERITQLVRKFFDSPLLQRYKVKEMVYSKLDYLNKELPFLNKELPFGSPTRMEVEQVVQRTVDNLMGYFKSYATFQSALKQNEMEAKQLLDDFEAGVKAITGVSDMSKIVVDVKHNCRLQMWRKPLSKKKN